MVRKGGNWLRRVASTWRALAERGSTLASTELNLIPRKGNPRTISAAALIVAIGTGRRMTKRESRYQKPSVTTVVSRLARLRRKRGESELTRVPSRVRTAGRTVSETAAAISATQAPPIPIE